jgi:hypothetical protein
MLAWATSLVAAEKRGVDQKVITIPTLGYKPQYLLEFSNGTMQWMNEAEKWQLKKVLIHSIHQATHINHTHRTANSS